MGEQRVLTLLDSTGIQPYIFGSNRLRENIGASELVARSTSSFVEQALQVAMGEQHDLSDLSKELPLEVEDSRQAEVIYEGGGNVALLFRNLDKAKATVRELSRLLLLYAPGLEVAAAHSEVFDWHTEKLADSADGAPGRMTRLVEQLAYSKQRRAKSAPLAGLGVMLACRSTGLPATCVYTDPDNNQLPVSAEIASKIGWRDVANGRLKQQVLTDPRLQSYAIPEDFDDLGRSKGELSYLAVVHADGNGMGKRFQEVGKDKGNRDYITAIRELSHKVNEAGLQALRKVVEELDAMLRKAEQETHDAEQFWEEERKDFQGGLPRSKAEEKAYLPFRPLVYGGDDVTFVCDGRLGLGLARRYLYEFEQATASLPGGPAHACAGVAIIKTHYPFARAYELADELCRSAKSFVRERKEVSMDEDASAIDWHFAASGRGASLNEIRKREYVAANDSTLNMRPLLLHSGTNDQLRTWSVFEQAAWKLKYSDDWRERRNKVIALRETLRQGKDAVQQFLIRYQIEKLPALAEGAEDARTKGFVATHCLYFDAIEALEIFLPLEPVQPLEDKPKERSA
ncbi:MAG: Cas10/Cmr2 second palm domain-containing protein [Roseiflexaceae bacterium]